MHTLSVTSEWWFGSQWWWPDRPDQYAVFIPTQRSEYMLTLALALWIASALGINAHVR